MNQKNIYKLIIAGLTILMVFFAILYVYEKEQRKALENDIQILNLSSKRKIEKIKNLEETLEQKQAEEKKDEAYPHLGNENRKEKAIREALKLSDEKGVKFHQVFGNYHIAVVYSPARKPNQEFYQGSTSIVAYNLETGDFESIFSLDEFGGCSNFEINNIGVSEYLEVDFMNTPCETFLHHNLIYFDKELTKVFEIDEKADEFVVTDYRGEQKTYIISLVSEGECSEEELLAWPDYELGEVTFTGLMINDTYSSAPTSVTTSCESVYGGNQKKPTGFFHDASELYFLVIDTKIEEYPDIRINFGLDSPQEPEIIWVANE